MHHLLNDDLARAVVDALRRHQDVRTSQVHVEAEGGIVTLDGWVDDIWVAAAIERTVVLVAGVVAVKNRLKVRTELGAEAQAKETEFGNAERARAMTGRGL